MEESKIAIVTIQRVKNYGAALQAYALQTTLFKLNYLNEILDYKRDIKKNKLVKSKYGYTGLLLVFAIEKLKQLRRYILNVIAFKDIRLKKLNGINDIFENFDKTFLIYSKKQYLESNLAESNKHYVGFVCGSDQVWNHNFDFSIDAFFLNFVEKGKRKIAFAPSFGIEDVPKSLHEKYQKSFNDFDFLSVREAEGAKILNEITGHNVPVLLDPIFLLSKNDWIENFSIKTQNNRKPFILCYTLGKEDEIALEICRKIASENDYDVVRLGRGRDDVKLNDLIVEWSVGPIEFLELIYNSKLVVTNSFHGTAFSINFNIPFFCVLSKKNKRTSRINNILRVFNLEERIVYEYDKSIHLKLNLKDPSTINDIILKEREKALEYLNKALV